MQGVHGGWPLFHDGPFNISASVKAYFALKAIGDAPDAPHMRRAREAILAHGGAGTTNVFTRILLALHGVIPWQAVPTIPVEIMHLPQWFPFHLFRISYWGRTVLAPLLVLQARTGRCARNPRKVVTHRQEIVSRTATARSSAARPACSASIAAVVCRVRIDRRHHSLHRAVFSCRSAQARHGQGHRVRHRTPQR